MRLRLRISLLTQIKLTTHKLTKLDHELEVTWTKKQCQINKTLEINKHTTKEWCNLGNTKARVQDIGYS